MAIKKTEPVSAAPAPATTAGTAPGKVKKAAAAAPAAAEKKENTAPATEEAPLAAVPDGEDAEAAAAFDDFVRLQEQFNDMSLALKNSMAVLKNLNKKYTKLYKASQKKKQKRGQSNADGTKRSSNGFAKPTKLSPSLCKFLGVPEGSEMGRVDVTKGLTKYIKDNGLVDNDDKRIIKPDSKLRAILSVKDGDQVTYFNLQKYIKHHFVKEDAPDSTA